jgi:hypothetical protein
MMKKILFVIVVCITIVIATVNVSINIHDKDHAGASNLNEALADELYDALDDDIIDLFGSLTVIPVKSISSNPLASTKNPSDIT